MAEHQTFFQVQPIATALERLLPLLPPLTRYETRPTTQALGHILAQALVSPSDLPSFTRSTMDGYAVRAADTFGASDALPAYLNVIGQVPMGAAPEFTLGSGQAAEIHTGGMLPAGADAVVMVERSQRISAQEVEILAPVALGENCVQVGEDVRQGSAILPAGARLRPQDLGGLLAVGIQQVTVVAPPRVSILSSGDELVTPEMTPQNSQVRDINASMLAALVTTVGAEAHLLGIAQDTFESLFSLAHSGLAHSDLLILSAGSSVSARDLTHEVLSRLGPPGVVQYGLAVKPGKPTILAVCDGKPVIGLPGNPVSALIVARQIVLPVLRHLTGAAPQPSATISAVLTQNLASAAGREDTIPVKLVATAEGWSAVPVLGKSNLIYTLLKADGLLHIPLDVSGYKAGTTVQVSLF